MHNTKAGAITAPRGELPREAAIREDPSDEPLPDMRFASCVQSPFRSELMAG